MARLAEIAFDVASTERALAAIERHPRFCFNFDPSHFVYQNVDYVLFIRSHPHPHGSGEASLRFSPRQCV